MKNNNAWLEKSIRKALVMTLSAGLLLSVDGGAVYAAAGTTALQQASTADARATQVTVTFNAAGGTASQNSRMVTTGEKIGTLPSASRGGYKFDGWYDGATKVTSEYVVSANTTLTAKWTAEAYTVTFDGNGGTAAEAGKTVEYGSSFGSLPTATRAGYTFAGWFTEKTGGSQITNATVYTQLGSQTVYAHWNPVVYSINFDANGGTVSPTGKDVTFAEAYGTLPYPTRTNYTFTGWFTAAAGGTQVADATKVTQTDPHTLYARWIADTASTRTVTLDPNGGNVSPTSIKVTQGATYSYLPTPTRAGYDFSGWFTALSGGTQVKAGDGVTSSTDITLHAQWSVKTYTVTFNANGGAVTPASQKVSSGEKYGALPTPTKSGAGFVGWFTAENGGTQITADSVVTLSSDITLYAHWSDNVYTITFDANGGNVTPASISVTFGAAYGTLPIPTRSGYVFTGWSLNGNKVTANTKVSTASSHTLAAQWIKDTGLDAYTVTFNANGGTVSPETITVKNKGIYGTLPTPALYGYDFVGWFTEATAGRQVYADDNVSLTGNQTLYAHWKEGETYVVTFNANGGTVSPSSKETKGTFGTLPTPTRSGYVFAGWYTTAVNGTNVTSETAITADTTLYAHWTEEAKVTNVTVNFDPNGGTVSPTSKTVEYGGIYGSLPTPVRSGYTFKGWYTADNYYIIENCAVTTNTSHTLHAEWISNSNSSDNQAAVVKGISIKSSLTIKGTNKSTLKVTFTPSSASTTVKWSSSNKKVATVSSKGVVKGVKAGTATITVRTADGRYKDTCKVTIKKVAVKSVKLNKKKATVKTGKKVTLKATISPSNAINKGVTYSSSNKNVATVSSKGVVTGKKKGTATITVKTKDGKKTYKCKITVK